MKRQLMRALGVVGLLAALAFGTGCTPEEQRTWLAVIRTAAEMHQAAQPNGGTQSVAMACCPDCGGRYQAQAGASVLCNTCGKYFVAR